MTSPATPALVTTDWLARHLDDPRVRIVDGSFHVPGSGRSPAGEFATRHIPGAAFFDIDAIRDEANPLPHMLPSAEIFAARVSELGIGDDTLVVAYDAPGSLAAPRVWWMLRCFGHVAVAVLDGGLAAWERDGRPTEAGPARPRPLASFTSRLRPELVTDRGSILTALGAGNGPQIVDARPFGRFAGADPEPRPVAPQGARNIPAMSLVDPGRGGLWRSSDELAAAFAGAGVDLGRPIVASCGSGVTACAIAFAAGLLCRNDVAVYDGSWAKWGSREETPVATADRTTGS